MRLPPEALPVVMVRALEAKRKVKEEASPEERAEWDAYQRAQREKMTARKARSTERTRTILTMMFAGAKWNEIADAVHMTRGALEKSTDRAGIPLSFRSDVRMRRDFYSQATLDQIASVAAVRGTTVDKTIEDAWLFLTADNAHVLRRLFHVKPTERTGT